MPDDGQLLDPPKPADKPKPRYGHRAELIRQLHDRNPKMPPSVIAKKVGCAPGHVTDTLKRYLNGIQLSDLDEFRSDKPAIFEAIQHRTLASISDEHLANASYLQLVTGAAILEDKLRLMSGLPTSIHVTALVDLAEVLRSRE